MEQDRLWKLTNNVLFLWIPIGMRKRAQYNYMTSQLWAEQWLISYTILTGSPVSNLGWLFDSDKNAQKQSFCGSMGADVREYCFTHGQLYVGLSEATHPSSIVILSESEVRKAKKIVRRKLFFL